MLKKLYKGYVTAFGHTQLLNSLMNLHPESDINLSPTASVERKSELYGDINIGEKSVIGSHCTVQGNVNIHPNVRIDSSSKINGNVEIDEGTKLNGQNEVIGEVSIGKYCAIAPRARMRTPDHPTNRAATQMHLYDRIDSKIEHVSDGPIRVGNDVWICSDVKILSDVSIGDGAVIGADSVVVDDVEPYSIVAGNPATHKKYRFDSPTREQLQKIQWWNWSINKMKRNKDFFETDLSPVDEISNLIKP